jgi:hypothetical protein
MKHTNEQKNACKKSKRQKRHLAIPDSSRLSFFSQLQGYQYILIIYMHLSARARVRDHENSIKEYFFQQNKVKKHKKVGTFNFVEKKTF